MKKVLVIGGNGFIGTNVTNYLINNGVYTSTYDLYKGNVGIENYQGNILDDENFESIIEGNDAIIYLITTVSPKKSMESPESAYKIDIPLLIKTLDICVKKNVKRVIFSSSGGTIYGETYTEKAREDDMKFPINNYAICKLTCENILNMYNNLYSMENISLRISNPYGVGQRPESGVGVITTFVDKICKCEELNLFGDGTITRDFVDVSNVAAAFYNAVNWNFVKDIDPVFNIGSGNGISLNEIIEIIEQTLNVAASINYLPKREFDVQNNVLDVSKAKKYLGYKPSLDEKKLIKEYIIEISKSYKLR